MPRQAENFPPGRQRQAQKRLQRHGGAVLDAIGQIGAEHVKLTASVGLIDARGVQFGQAQAHILHRKLARRAALFCPARVMEPRERTYLRR